jgi:hypothetical protein
VGGWWAAGADSGPQPATDCFVVHAADDPDLPPERAGRRAADADREHWLRFAECSLRLSQQSATEPGDETLKRSGTTPRT